MTRLKHLLVLLFFSFFFFPPPFFKLFHCQSSTPRPLQVWDPPPPFPPTPFSPPSPLCPHPPPGTKRCSEGSWTLLVIAKCGAGGAPSWGCVCVCMCVGWGGLGGLPLTLQGSSSLSVVGSGVFRQDV